MPERGWRSSSAILAKRPPTWPTSVVIVAVRDWKSAAEGADIDVQVWEGEASKLIQMVLEVVGRGVVLY